MPTIVIPTIEEMYQHYLKLVNLKESNMHPAQKQETKRAFFGAVGLFLVCQREQISAILDEEKAVDELEKQWQEVSAFWGKEISPNALSKN